MVDTVPALIDLLEVLEELRDTRREVAQLLARKDRALAAWQVASGVSKRGAGPALRQVLEERGWPQADVDLVSVSDGTVRGRLDRVRATV